MSVEINGLRLPDSLVAAIEDERWTIRGKDWAGRWHHADHIEIARRVFPRGINSRMFSLCGFDCMRRENRNWNSKCANTDCYLGAEAQGIHPGTIDRDQSVIIGFTDADYSIALDYRWKPDDPSIVYLFSYEGKQGSWWDTAAGNVEDLIVRLEL